MNIRFIGIDGLWRHDVNRIFFPLTVFDFIKKVEIRTVQLVNHDTKGDVSDIYDVSIEIDPDRNDISIHIYDDVIHIVDHGCRHKAYIYLDRSAYERLEMI